NSALKDWRSGDGDALTSILISKYYYISKSSAADQRAIDVDGPRHRGVDRVPLADHGLAGPRHRPRALGVAEQVQDRGGECARVRRGHQAAVLAVADQLGASTDCGGHDGRTDRESLGNYLRDRLRPDRGERQHVERR